MIKAGHTSTVLDLLAHEFVIDILLLMPYTTALNNRQIMT
jgi:hypothetical protein